MTDKIFDITNTDLVELRSGTEEDLSFVLATWLKGLKYGNRIYKLVEDRVYYIVYHQVLERLLKKPTIKITVACLKEDPSVILGYSVSEGPNLHWIFVKKSWRNIGVGTLLFPIETTTVTHITDSCIPVLSSKGLIFNPFLL